MHSFSKVDSSSNRSLNENQEKSLNGIPEIELHHPTYLATALLDSYLLRSLNCAINKNERNRDIFYDGRFNCSLTRFISNVVLISHAYILNKQIRFIS